MYTLVRFRNSRERRKALSHRHQSHKLKDLTANYFIQECYKQAAISVVQTQETRQNGITDSEMEVDDASIGTIDLSGFSSIDKRKQIKYLILRGDILQAVKVIGVYYPTILDNDKLLLFKLLRLNLIEMIREHKFSKEPKSEAAEKKFLESVLRFVRENLISKITGSMELLKDLEITMSLLCFDFEPSKLPDQLLELPEKTRELFNLSLRNECYRAVNQVILDFENNTLSRSASQQVQYKGIPFVDYDSAMLDLLPEAEPLLAMYPAFDSSTIPGFQEVSHLRGNPQDLGSMIAYAAPAEQPIGEEPPKTSSQSYQLSRLEEICRLWVATELMLASKHGNHFREDRMQL